MFTGICYHIYCLRLCFKDVDKAAMWLGGCCRTPAPNEMILHLTELHRPVC